MCDDALTQKHVCAYCGKEYVAKKPFSHIIPKQFFRRFKMGINNKDMYSTYYHRKTQREPIEFLLCHDCEEVFCKWENKFASEITDKIYGKTLPSKLYIDVDVKLCALSILWRVLHCWVVSNTTKKGSLNDHDIEYLTACERKWFDILKQQRDFQIEEADIFVIPVDCIENSNQDICDYKKYPGIMANIVYEDQGDNKGYFCLRCLAHKILFFAYLPSIFTIPKGFSIHNATIEVKKTTMPKPIVEVFVNYAEDARRITI